MCLGLSISALVILRELTNAIEVNLGRHSLQFCWCFSVLCEIRRIECIASSPSFSLAQCLPCPFRSMLRTLFSARGAALPWPVHPSVIAAQTSSGLASKVRPARPEGPTIPATLRWTTPSRLPPRWVARWFDLKHGRHRRMSAVRRAHLRQVQRAAFAATDYALLAARKHDMRAYHHAARRLRDLHTRRHRPISCMERNKNPQDFFSDPGSSLPYEHHIDAVLNHVNSLTGVRYRDDPTISPGKTATCAASSPCSWRGVEISRAGSDWVRNHRHPYQEVDPRHLYLDTSGIFRSYPPCWTTKRSDLVTFE